MDYVTAMKPLEYKLKKFETLFWTYGCDTVFILLKEKLVSSPILVFSSSEIEFHVHFNASTIALGVVFTHLGEGDINYPIYFSNHK